MPTPPISPEAPLAMTLAGMAYAFPEDIERYLASRTATRGWTATWLPEERKGYFAYVAASPSANAWAVAVRGTNPSFTRAFVRNLISDLNVRRADDWVLAPGRGARIAAGAQEGLEVLATLENDRKETLQQHLASNLPPGATLLVTGHSLGGCLASVLALRLHHEYGGRFQVRPITFAAPTAGNRPFAELYQETFPGAERYFNRLDLVPRAWCELAQLGDLYEPPGPRCPPDFRLLARATAGSLSQHGYTQPGPGVALPLEGAGPPRPGRGGLGGMVDRLLRRVFYLEALHHHMPDTYLAHLGAEPLPFQFPLRWFKRNVTRRLSRLVARR
jgi:hypothetical protein